MAWPSSYTIWGSLLSKIQADIAKLAKEVAKYEPVIMCAEARRPPRRPGRPADPPSR
ncbi:agmatine deiminase family protein [Streptomyces narbonensis]|uniref:Agmatine deiminase family protein n=1 Tax=Streptomyces narbonensis TaxID=67333 RepID=A0ABV3CBJ5_9ACTN